MISCKINMHIEISRRLTFLRKQTAHPKNQLSVHTLAQKGFYHGEDLGYMDMYPTGRKCYYIDIYYKKYILLILYYASSLIAKSLNLNSDYDYIFRISQ